jgi:3-deoxy-D-manno-octulosonic acid kinase
VNAELPAGYLPLEAAGARGFVLAPGAAWLESVLREYGTLRAWADRSAASSLEGGRGVARVVAAAVSGPDGRTQWVCRAYRRGGLVAPLLRDRYFALAERRPFAELRASAVARARGVRTPAVMAGAVYPTGPFYRADLASECIPGVRSLADVLFARSMSPPRAELLHAAGRLVGSLERARVEHRDLNATNLLVPLEPFTSDLWVVDLDRCRVHPPEASPPVPAMRRRLERSLAKLGSRHARALSSPEWAALRAGYGGTP